MAKISEIVLFHSNTGGVVPTSAQLIEGELALNTVDGRLFTENASATVIELGTTPSTVTTGAIVATSITASGVVTANSSLASSNLVATGGTLDGVVIGGSTAASITGSVITASTNFVGALTGSVTGNTAGTHTGPTVGDVQGNVVAGSGTTTLQDLVINGTVDFNAAELTDIGTPTADTSAATRGYVTTQINNLVNSAPAALDTLAELSSALGDDANFSTTITNSIATKLPLAGGTMSGAIAMGSNKITGLTSGTASGDAVNKGQLDAMLPLAGGTLTGNLDAGSNSVSSSHTPGSANDLTNKSYVDSILGSATSAASSASAAAASASSASSDAASISGSVTSAQTAATTAETHLDTFQDQYLGSVGSDPTTDLDGDPLASGTLAFLTTTNQLRVYNGSTNSWQDAGSAVNGTSSRDTYTATANQTTFSVTGGYDSGFLDLFLNGVKMLDGTDFTATNGTSVVLTHGAAAGDIVDIVAYGTFTLLNEIGNTDGGFANSTYTTAQNIDGGTASG